MTEERTIWLARHGMRIDFIDKQWQGRHAYDPYLAPEGVEQAGQTGRRLQGEGIRHIYASPFWRTVETAHAIAEWVDLPLHIEPGAAEWLKQGWFAYQPPLTPMGDLAAHFPRVAPDHAPVCMPIFPESEEAVQARYEQTINGLLRRHDDDFLVVGHGATVRGMLWALTGDEAVMALCGLTKVVGQPGNWRLELNGDVSHLEAGAQATERLQADDEG